MSVLVMMMIAGTFGGGTINAANHYDKEKGEVVFEKSKEYKPKKEKKKKTVFGFEVKKVKPR